MQIGVSSYSFSKLVRAGKLTEIDVVKRAKDMGFDVIEFSTITVPEGETLPSYAEKIRKAADEVSLPISAYTIGADFINPEGADWREEVKRLKGELEIAKILGAPRMRHDATRGFSREHTGPRGFFDALPTLAQASRAVTDVAAKMGIATMIENHGFFCQDSERVEALINAVDHPNFGLLVDVGNFLCVDEDPTMAMGRVAPYVIHAHMKDFHVKPGYLPDPGKGWFRSRAGNYLRGSIIGHGEVPVHQCTRLLADAGYDGVLSLEFEGMEHPLVGIEVGAENLRAAVEAATHAG